MDCEFRKEKDNTCGLAEFQPCLYQTEEEWIAACQACGCATDCFIGPCPRAIKAIKESLEQF